MPNKISRTHACNCVGCCKKCGECLTAPWHSVKNCIEFAKLAKKRKDLIDGVLEAGI